MCQSRIHLYLNSSWYLSEQLTCIHHGPALCLRDADSTRHTALRVQKSKKCATNMPSLCQPWNSCLYIPLASVGRTVDKFDKPLRLILRQMQWTDSLSEAAEQEACIHLFTSQPRQRCKLQAPQPNHLRILITAKVPEFCKGVYCI